MYIIAKGTVVIETSDANGFKIEKILGDGKHFGEIGVIMKCRRTATVVSHNYCTLGVVSESDMKLFLENNFECK